MCALCMRQSRETLHELLTRRLGEMPESLVSSVKSFPSGSAPGPSGLRPTHVRKAVLCPSADRSRESLLALTKFVNLLASGRTPQSVLEVLRRLVSKCLAQAVRSSALSVLAPLQLGVNVKGGCEAIIHAVSHLMNSPIVEHIQEHVPNMRLNSWYLDDGTLVGSPDQLAAALDIIEP